MVTPCPWQGEHGNPMPMLFWYLLEFFTPAVFSGYSPIALGDIIGKLNAIYNHTPYYIAFYHIAHLGQIPESVYSDTRFLLGVLANLFLEFSFTS